MKYELISISRIFVVAFCLYKVFIAGLNYLNLSAEKAFFGEELINKDERIQTMVDSLHASLQEFVCQTECGNYIIQYEFEGKRYSIEIVDFSLVYLAALKLLVGLMDQLFSFQTTMLPII